jgi:two-component system LytT family response regulator
VSHRFSAIIIDDEIRSRSILHTMLGRYCPQISIAAEADNIDDALLLIRDVAPDIVFLDIELGHGSGFDLMGQLDTILFETIFVTAFEGFAIKAIKWSAQDYLLKPVDPAELQAAVNKTVHKIRQNRQHRELAETFVKGNKIGLPSQDGLKFIAVDSIIRCEAKGAYTEFHLTDKTKLTISRNLHTYETLLDPYGFYRVHHAHLISMEHIKEYIKGRGGSLIMSDNTEISIAIRKRDDFLKHILH